MTNNIENLPISLQYFSCYSNEITKIENLPIGLQSIFYSGNTIEFVDNIECNRINFTLSGYQAYLS